MSLIQQEIHDLKVHLDLEESQQRSQIHEEDRYVEGAVQRTTGGDEAEESGRSRERCHTVFWWWLGEYKSGTDV